MTALILIMDITIVIVALSFCIIPYVTRRTESFGVSIPENEFDNEDLREMRKFFVKGSIATGVIFLVLVSYALIKFGENAFLITFAVLLETAVLFLLYYYLHRKMKAYKEDAQWIDRISHEINAEMNEQFMQEKKGASPLWFALYAVIIAVSIAVTLYVYPSLPDMIPMQYDFDGNVTRYAEKSLSSAMMIPGVNIFLALTFLLAYVMVVKAKRMIDPENPAESAWRIGLFRAAWVNFSVFAGLIMVGSMTLLHFALLNMFSVVAATIIILAVSLLIVVWAIYLAFRYGQGGSRINRDRKKGTMLNVADDDRYWKIGVLYFNRDDPALFVEKRFGVGFTVNFAKPVVWAIIIAILAISIGITVFSVNL
jgi:uncharacterized membrane protein